MAGHYVQLTAEYIKDGQFIEQFNKQLKRAMQSLDEHERATGLLDGKAGLTVAVTIKRHPNSDEMFDIDFDFQRKLPKIKDGWMHRGAGGKLLYDLENGAPDGEKDQMVMTFDRFAQPAGRMNPVTGEVEQAEGDEPAGKIGNAG